MALNRTSRSPADSRRGLGAWADRFGAPARQGRGGPASRRRVRLPVRQGHQATVASTRLLPSLCEQIVPLLTGRWRCPLLRGLPQQFGLGVRLTSRADVSPAAAAPLSPPHLGCPVPVIPETSLPSARAAPAPARCRSLPQPEQLQGRVAWGRVGLEAARCAGPHRHGHAQPEAHQAGLGHQPVDRLSTKAVEERKVLAQGPTPLGGVDARAW